MLRIKFILFFIAWFATGALAQKNNCFHSQKQADIWYFGQKAGIDFRSGTAIPLTNENVMNSNSSTAVISDSVGNLLFFTDSKKIWDRTFDTLPYAPTMEGSQGATQPCLIIPKPGDSNLYYVFTVDIILYNNPPSDTTVYRSDGLKYCVVDMNLRGGYGDGTNQWHLPLLNPVSQKITAVKHKNGKDYWLIAHKWNSDEFYAYPVTENGIGNPVVSSIGIVHGTGRYGVLNRNDLGYMKCSPDGSKVAVAVTGKKVVEIFDFNTSTGAITAPQTYTFTDQGINPYGIEFSSDNKMLYTTLLKPGGSGAPDFPSKIYQFNLNNGLTSPVLIDSVPGLRVGGMQLGTDGRIYVAKTVYYLPFVDSLDVIYNPTRPGLECNYNKFNGTVKGFSLQGRKILFGLTNFIQSYFNRPLFSHDSVCDGDMTMFRITNTANVDSVRWTFGDGSTSTAFDPLHLYSQTGNYTVKLTEFYNGISYVDSVAVKILDLPAISLGGDTLLMYKGASLNLYAGQGYADYTWSTGAKDNMITVEDGGDYWARVMDANCCYNSDTVFVNVFEFYLPNAFTPDDDGLNDVFRMKGLYQNVKIHMYIYDRWGKLAFETDDYFTGWDGKISGQPAPEGTYAWIVNIEFPANDIVTNGKVVLKGSVILLR